MNRRPAFAEYNIEERWTTLQGSVLVGSMLEDGPGPHALVPHRHDFVELVWLSQGSGTHRIDTAEFPARPRTLHLIAPGQVHCWHPDATAVDGTLVLFREDFLIAQGGAGLQSWRGGMTTPSPATATRLDRLVREIRDELDGDADDREVVARHLVSAFVTVCQREVARPAPPQHTVAAAFQRLVRERPTVAVSVAEWSRRLAVTPKYLTEVVTADTGRSPSTMIRSAVRLEAERMLAATTLSCAQIADTLEFDDPSYFSRFFRRETGMTPSSYRRRHGTLRAA